MAEMVAEILSQQWREDHVRAGDAAVIRAGSLATEGLVSFEVATMWAAVAQAHYAAANVRAKQVVPPVRTMTDFLSESLES